MAEYTYEGGVTIERPMGKAPAFIRRGGKRLNRVYEMPQLRELNGWERGDKPMVSNQLPTWYGYRQREKCWSEFMKRQSCEDTVRNRQAFQQRGMGPTPQYIERKSKEAALRAGAERDFTRDGKPAATTKKGIHRQLETAKTVGDRLEWS